MSYMLRNYQYLVGENVNRQYEGESLKNYIEGEVGAAVSNLTNFAPADLDSLGEIAAALQNNPDFLTTLQGRDADLLAAIGISAGDQNVGAMTTTELPDDETVKALFESIGEAARRLREGLGVAQGDSDMGEFNGAIIANASSVKNALQALETFAEAEVDRVNALIASDMWLFADQAAFPAAADNHGRVVHSHADGAMFYAHGGMWHELAKEADSSSADTALASRLDILEADPTTASAVAVVQADVDANELDSDAADAALSLRLDALEADPTTASAVALVQADVDQNEADADAAIAAVQADVDQNEADADAAIAVERGRIDAILESSAADADSFAEIVALVNSVDTENDSAFAGYVTSNDAALATERGRIDAVEAEIDTARTNIYTALGQTEGATAMGTFTGSTLGDGQTVKQLLQALETATETEISDRQAAIADILDGATFTGDIVLGTLARLKESGNELKIQNDAQSSSIIVGPKISLQPATGSRVELHETVRMPDGTDLTVTGAELNFVDGVTSNIQTQLDAIQADVDQNESDADAAIALKLDASAVSAFGGTLIDDADAATARATLGLDAATLRSILGITENAGDPADNRGMYYDTVASQYLLSS